MQRAEPVGGPVVPPARRPPLLWAAAAGALAGGLAAVLYAHGASVVPRQTAAAAAGPVARTADTVVAAPGRLDVDAATGPAATPTPDPPAPAQEQPAAPAPPQRRAARPPVPAPRSPVTAVAPSGPAAQTLALVNRDRAAAGLPALQLDGGLARAAAEHAAQNAVDDQMSHNGLYADVAQQGVSWHYLGECLGEVHPGPDPGFVNGLWMQSPEHRPIILDGHYTRAGVGWAEAANGDWFVSLIVDG